MKAVHNNAAGVRDRLFAGDDLRILLEPDETVASRKGDARYIEALDLPHVVGHGPDFWASQRNLVVKTDGGKVVRGAYAYYSGADIFARNAYDSDDAAKARRPLYTQLMSTGRYRRLKWVTAARNAPVYDSDDPDDKAAYIAAIEAGRSFKALLEFPEGHFQIHPVIYPFHYPGRDALDVQTEMQFFPDYTRMAQADFLKKVLGAKAEIFADYRDPVRREKNLAFRYPFFCSYFRIFDGARGKRIYDLESDNEIAFARVRLFASEA